MHHVRSILAAAVVCGSLTSCDRQPGQSPAAASIKKGLATGERPLGIADVRIASTGTPVSFPTGDCPTTLGKPDTVIKLVIPSNFPNNGLKGPVVRKKLDEATDIASGSETVIPTATIDYKPPWTRLDFDVKTLLQTKKIIAVKIVLRHKDLYFDKPAITLTRPKNETRPTDQEIQATFCGLKILSQSDESEGTGKRRPVAKFYIMNTSPTNMSYGYNIHLKVKEDDSETDYDIPITIDPQVTNNG